MPYDVAAFQTKVASSLPVPQSLWELDGTGRVVGGIVKLAQRFLLELLTIRGSMPFALNRGSSLLSFARQGRIRSDVDAYVLFGYAVSEVEENLWADETDADPPAERFVSATVLGVTFSLERLIYRISITSRAGTTREVVLPLPAVP